MQRLSVKSPKPGRFPAYTIESAAGEVLATVPITASGNSHKLALAMAAAPELLAACEAISSAITDAAGANLKVRTRSLMDIAKWSRAAIAATQDGTNG